MAFKRNIDRLPIIPADAKTHNVTCHYCIVGCGYKAYTWPVNKQGGTSPAENAMGAAARNQGPSRSGTSELMRPGSSAADSTMNSPPRIAPPWKPPPGVRWPFSIT